MKTMTKFLSLALLAGAMVSCSTEDTAPSTQNDKVAVQFTGGISLNPNRSLEKVSCHFLMTAIRKTALYMLDS